MYYVLIQTNTKCSNDCTGMAKERSALRGMNRISEPSNAKIRLPTGDTIKKMAEMIGQDPFQT